MSALIYWLILENKRHLHTHAILANGTLCHDNFLFLDPGALDIA